MDGKTVRIVFAWKIYHSNGSSSLKMVKDPFSRLMRWRQKLKEYDIEYCSAAADPVSLRMEFEGPPTVVGK